MFIEYVTESCILLYSIPHAFRCDLDLGDHGCVAVEGAGAELSGAERPRQDLHR
jgi:hypothetical protein